MYRAEVLLLGIVALFIPSKVLCAASGRTRVPHTIVDLYLPMHGDNQRNISRGLFGYACTFK